LAHGDVADEPGDGGDDGEAVELEGEAFQPGKTEWDTEAPESQSEITELGAVGL
jgi:hypothetical protein